MKMMVLVTYDVKTETPEGRRRLRQVAKECINYGQRVQNSVFECLVDPIQFAKLQHSLKTIMEKKKDSIRFYYLGDNWQNRVEHFGDKKGYDPEGLLVA
jgi:CRISPR-associated protein Cas2